jgi:hypothetical protein
MTRNLVIEMIAGGIEREREVCDGFGVIMLQRFWSSGYAWSSRRSRGGIFDRGKPSIFLVIVRPLTSLWSASDSSLSYWTRKRESR